MSSEFESATASSVMLRNARIDGGLVDVRIDDGVVTRISAVIPETDLPERDVDGRWLLPGLWDEHVHFTQWALSSTRVDLSAAASAAEAAAMVRRAADSAHPESAHPESGVGTVPIVGYGFRDATWPDTPTREVLDAAVASPVVLISGDLHCAWANTAGLAWLDRSEHTSGILREELAWQAFAKVDELPDATVDEWAIAAGRRAASRGVVGFVDLEMTWTADTWSRRVARGFDSQRVEFGIYPQFLDRALAAGFTDGQLLPDTRGLVSVGPLKVVTDGSLNTRTAYCSFEYPGLDGGDHAHAHGVLSVPEAELLDLMRRATAGGLRSAIHAIGDRANTIALDAFAATGAHGSIEHAQLVDPADIARFASLGVTASVQPEHAMDDRDVADRLWSDHTADSFPLASLLRGGATLAFGSDAPVAPLDPWITMSAAVLRSRDGREPWHPEQRLTLDEALGASARGRQVVRRGDVADLVVVDEHPSTAGVESLRETRVAATLLGGRFTHDAL